MDGGYQTIERVTYPITFPTTKAVVRLCDVFQAHPANVRVSLDHHDININDIAYWAIDENYTDRVYWLSLSY